MILTVAVLILTLFGILAMFNVPVQMIPDLDARIIPICTIAAFLGLLLTGRTINVISLAGVAFAIGMNPDVHAACHHPGAGGGRALAQGGRD